ncbi:MAG: alpha-D-ribose 1-methylphosphonate 5-triphosphate diphosphatase [Sedimentitalea sp.]
MGTFTIQGAQVFLPDDIVETNVIVSDGVIVDIGSAAQGDVIKGQGLILAPALIDVHGDAFERQLMPRPGVFFPVDVAFLETDRQLAANGIATTYHSLTLGWEPGLRSVTRGQDVLAALARLAPRFTVENRVQLRWETFAFEAVDTIIDALGNPRTPSLAFNDHTSMQMRSFDLPIQERAFEQSATFATATFDDPRLRARQTKMAARAGLSIDDYMAALKQIWARRSDVPGSIRKLAAHARTVGAPMLSHDDTQSEARQYYRALGATVAEFPMTIGPTQDARDNGDLVIFGAPNVVRGGSHIGSLAAADMVEAGLCDVLASDYFYPAMLAAVARLDAEKRAPRHHLWSLLSSGPARAMSLSDRGNIVLGQRADLVLVDWPILLKKWLIFERWSWRLH